MLGWPMLLPVLGLADVLSERDSMRTCGDWLVLYEVGGSLPARTSRKQEDAFRGLWLLITPSHDRTESPLYATRTQRPDSTRASRHRWKQPESGAESQPPNFHGPATHLRAGAGRGPSGVSRAAETCASFR